MSSFIEVKNLVYEYKDMEKPKRAVNNISLEIQKGKFIAVLGHNGSGKSTFAKNLNTIFTPTSGTIIIDNIDTKKEDRVFEIRQKCGMVFQNPDNQIVATVVEDDVAFGPENMGIPSDEIRKRVDEALETVRMSEFSSKAPHLLSGGQKQRIAIAGIIAMKPECIILDESTAMLDPRGRKEVIGTVEKLNKEENITVVHITHFMEEAIRADYIYVMEEGEIVMQGSPKEVFSNVEDLEKLGLDVPPMTRLAYDLRKKGININNQILTVQEMAEALCQLK